MLQSCNAEAPAYVYNDQELTVEYSFVEYAPARQWISNNKLWLYILFVHPHGTEVVTIRVVKSTLLLCQSKEVIEAIVHREIRHFLHQAQVKEYGTACNQLQPIPAF